MVAEWIASGKICKLPLNVNSFLEVLGKSAIQLLLGQYKLSLIMLSHYLHSLS